MNFFLEPLRWFVGFTNALFTPLDVLLSKASDPPFSEKVYGDAKYQEPRRVRDIMPARPSMAEILAKARQTDSRGRDRRKSAVFEHIYGGPGTVEENLASWDAAHANPVADVLHAKAEIEKHIGLEVPEPGRWDWYGVPDEPQQYSQSGSDSGQQSGYDPPVAVGE